MPKPNLPPHAGPYQPAYTPPTGASGTANPDSSIENPNAGSQRHAVPQPYLTQNNQPEKQNNLLEILFSHPERMIWVALAFLGFGLIFAVAAIIHHG